MKESPLVSIIVAVKNETVLLKQSIADLLAQTYENIEIIIADDGSGQETKDVLRSFKDPRIKIVTLPRSQGQSAARNEAFAIASGTYIAIADADDRYHEQRIELQVDFMEIHPHIDVLGSEFQVKDGHKTWNIYYHHTEIFHQMLINNPMVHSSVFFKSELLQNGFHFRNAYDTAEDYDVFARHRKIWIFHNINRPLIEYTINTRTAEATNNQRSKARKVREHVLKEYIHDATPEEIDLHHDLCELNPNRSFFELNLWIQKLKNAHISNNQNHNIFLKILYRQFWLYIGRCNVNCTKKTRIRILKTCKFDFIYYYKSAFKILIGRPL